MALSMLTVPASGHGQIDSKQKALGRAQEDAQNDFTEQQNEIVQTILQKLLPVVNKYAKDNGLTLVVDGSKPWPEWPVLWASPSVDITKAVVDIYNLPPGAHQSHRGLVPTVRLANLTLEERRKSRRRNHKLRNLQSRLADRFEHNAIAATFCAVLPQTARF
jgi:hypothetical protein